MDRLSCPFGALNYSGCEPKAAPAARDQPWAVFWQPFGVLGFVAGTFGEDVMQATRGFIRY